MSGRGQRGRLPVPGAQGAPAARARRCSAERAREEDWSYEEYLAAVLGEEVAARESHGGEARVKAARFPAGEDPRRLRL